MKPKIVMLPHGRWKLVVPSEGVSQSAEYRERIMFGGYLAQTEYWGTEAVWKINPALIPHTTEDRSCDEE